MQPGSYAAADHPSRSWPGLSRPSTWIPGTRPGKTSKELRRTPRFQSRPAGRGRSPSSSGTDTLGTWRWSIITDKALVCVMIVWARPIAATISASVWHAPASRHPHPTLRAKTAAPPFSVAILFARNLGTNALPRRYPRGTAQERGNMVSGTMRLAFAFSVFCCGATAAQVSGNQAGVCCVRSDRDARLRRRQGGNHGQQQHPDDLRRLHWARHVRVGQQTYRAVQIRSGNQL
jgi:hypothetical protein